jgi:hypothetical protein
LPWKPSQVVDQRTPEQKPLLAPIVADPVSFLVSFHLSSGSGEEEKNGAGKMG